MKSLAYFEPLRRTFFKNVILLIGLTGLLFGCAGAGEPDITLSGDLEKNKDKEFVARAKQVVTEINLRNKTVEKSPEWIREAYKGIKLKRLLNIPPDQYADYSKYLSNGNLYVIVHPSFYPFFETDLVLSSKSDSVDLPVKNLVERFYDKATFYMPNIKVMQEQEKLMKKFLEYASIEKKLILLIVPRDYKEHLSYGYREGLDEYARYVNEITNMSDSVIYMESADWATGYIKPEDLSVLKKFVNAVRPQRIIIGGGYIGRCLENFYRTITVPFNNVFVSPEISAASPQDLNNEWGNRLLTEDGKINAIVAFKNLDSFNAYGVQQYPPKIKLLKDLHFLFE